MKAVHIFCGLDGKPERDFAGAVENLKQTVADETAKLAWLSWCRQLDPTITSAALRTHNIGLSHVRKGITVFPVVPREPAQMRNPMRFEISDFAC